MNMLLRSIQREEKHVNEVKSQHYYFMQINMYVRKFSKRRGDTYK